MNKTYIYFTILLGTITSLLWGMEPSRMGGGYIVRPTHTQSITSQDMGAEIQGIQSLCSETFKTVDALSEQIERDRDFAIYNGIGKPKRIIDLFGQMPHTDVKLKVIGESIKLINDSIRKFENQISSTSVVPNVAPRINRISRDSSEQQTLTKIILQKEALKYQLFDLDSKFQKMCKTFSKCSRYLETFFSPITGEIVEPDECEDAHVSCEESESSLFAHSTNLFGSSYHAPCSDPQDSLCVDLTKLSIWNNDSQAKACSTASRVCNEQDALCQQAADCLIDQIYKTLKYLPQNPNSIGALIVEKEAQIISIGDIHGGYDEVRATLNRINQEHHCFENQDINKLNPHYYIVFHGDIADRGPEGLKAWKLIMDLFIKNPEQIFILHGNHESEEMAKFMGFFEKNNFAYTGDIDREYPVQHVADQVKTAFLDLFNHLPHALFMGKFNPSLGKVVFGLYLHGGIADASIEEIQFLLMNSVNKEIRYSGSMTKEAVCGFSWSDFHNKMQYMLPSNRGGDVKSFNRIFAEAWLQKLSTNNFEVLFIVRAHEHSAECISFLNYPGDSAIWIPLEDDTSYVIQPCEVFTLMCLSETIKREIPDLQNFGAGMFFTDEQDNWCIRTIMTPYKDKAKYLPQEPC